MTEIANYPECLRRPDAGGHVQTRTTQTEARYRKRYKGLAKTWCRRHEVDSVTPFEVATDVGYRASGLTRNALKQYHAAIRQHLRDQWDEGSIGFAQVERIDALLRQQAPMAKATKGRAGRRTSAGRAKSITPETLSALVTELMLRQTPIRRIAAALLKYGVELATRPSEFLTIREDPMGRLWVRSAKYSQTNQKGLQAARKLIVDNLEASQTEELKEIDLLLRSERARKPGTNLLRRCQHAIREARKAVGGKARRVSGYTVRHQARANMAAMGMSPKEIAVVMNHASAMTAQSHYAPARSAWPGTAKVKPPAVDPDLVDKVRAGNSSRGWIIQTAREPKPMW